ncbi:MAG: hypothetical protein JWM05_667 [Acidimicrobiales bacterium]|nr:hypothetical protein [Acidimicrobiales bacterium]
MEQHWYWCLRHQRVEQEPDVPAEEWLGPYPSEEAARNWKVVHDAREDAWKKQDDEWEGDAD